MPAPRAKAVFNLTQFLRFLAVGFTGVALDGIVYLGALQLSDSVEICKGLGFMAGAIFAYFANWKFTFRGNRSRFSGILFIIVYASSLTINIFGNKILVAWLADLPFEILVSFVVITGITTIWNYVGMALFVFKRHKGVTND